MPEQLRRTRLLAVAAAMAAIAPPLATVGSARASALQAGAAAHVLDLRAGTSARQGGGLPAGPAQIGPLGHPGLCWEAWGDGSAVTLETCTAALQGQEWTFTTDNVLLNGNGYCLQDGGPGGEGNSLYLSFSGQCAGSSSQQWTFDGATGSVRNAAEDVCAYVQGAALVPGADIVGRRCGSTGSWDTWSQGTSDLALSVPRQAPGAHPRGRGGTGGTGSHRAFTARVTVSNAARAMTAYDATISVRPPGGLTVTRLAGTGGLSGWACAVRTLECRGNLGGGSSGQLTITGTLARRPTADAIAVRATVGHTNQVRQAAVTAAVPVQIYTAAASAAPAGGAHGMLTGSTAAFGLIVAVLLVGLGIFLAVVTRRRRQPAPTPAGAGPQDQPVSAQER